MGEKKKKEKEKEREKKRKGGRGEKGGEGREKKRKSGEKRGGGREKKTSRGKEKVLHPLMMENPLRKHSQGLTGASSAELPVPLDTCISFLTGSQASKARDILELQLPRIFISPLPTLQDHPELPGFEFGLKRICNSSLLLLPLQEPREVKEFLPPHPGLLPKNPPSQLSPA